MIDKLSAYQSIITPILIDRNSRRDAVAHPISRSSCTNAEAIRSISEMKDREKLVQALRAGYAAAHMQGPAMNAADSPRIL
jgi:hypothetical protein